MSACPFRPGDVVVAKFDYVAKSEVEHSLRKGDCITFKGTLVLASSLLRLLLLTDLDVTPNGWAKGIFENRVRSQRLQSGKHYNSFCCLLAVF